MTRRLWAAVALLSVLMLGGCSVAVDSRIDEYQKTAEDLATHVVQLIPSDLQPVQDAASEAITAVTGSLAQEGWSSSRVRETDGG